MDQRHVFTCYRYAAMDAGHDATTNPYDRVGFFDGYESVVMAESADGTGSLKIVAAYDNVDFSVIDVGFLIQNPVEYRAFGFVAGAPMFSDFNTNGYVITSKEIDEGAGTVTFTGAPALDLVASRVLDTPTDCPSTANFRDVCDALFVALQTPTATRNLNLWAYSPTDYTADAAFGRLGDDVSLPYKDGLTCLQTVVDAFNGSHARAWFSSLAIVSAVEESNVNAAIGASTHATAIIGLDRSTSHTLGGVQIVPVRFSTELQNIVNASITADVKGTSNVALVAGSGEGTARIKVWTPATGLNPSTRRETFVDARDLARDDYATTAAYNAALRSRGVQKLVSQVNEYSFEIPPTSPYKYKRDFYLGDAVAVDLPRFGVSLTVPVTGAVETWDANGYSCDLTFGTARETLGSRLKKRYGI